MALSPGSKVGPYEVRALLGAGGMGEVYRAHDPALQRDIAIKVLPEALAADGDRLARFEREARVLASLSHPNIAAIHGLERLSDRPCLVMELVPGETLAARLTKGALPLADALRIAMRIAAGLEAAHAGGVIHRDLKPANVIVTPDGGVKVLDFGLARRLNGAHSDPDLSNSPTQATGQTSAGVLLGTGAYMSPEQARGSAVDRRTDIWSFGCVLYEMLAGRPAFGGRTLADVLAAVLSAEPDWSALPATAPATVRRLLRRCLSKDPAARVHDIADARLELEDATTGPKDVDAGTATKPRSRLAAFVPWTVAALSAAMLVANFYLGASPPGLPAGVMRLELDMPAGVETSFSATPNFAMSADGTTIAFIGIADGVRHIFIRRLDEFVATRLRGTESANACTFAPDGTAVAFISSDRALKKVTLRDGLVTTIVRDADYSAGGLSWARDGSIVFVRGSTLWRVRAEGGPPEALTRLDDSRRELLHLWPTHVGDSESLLFAAVARGDRVTTRIEVITLATGTRRPVMEDAGHPLYAASGHLLFSRGSSVLAAPFDVRRLETTGPAVSVLDLESVGLDQIGNPLIALSPAGVLTYVARAASSKQLVWVSRQGIEQPITETPRPYQIPRISSDGTRIVVDAAGGDLWIHDLARATFTQLTSSATLGNTFGVWTPDTRQVVFRTIAGLHAIDTDGSGRLVAVPTTSVADVPTAVAPDGRTLAFIRQSADTSGDIYTVSLTGAAEARPVVVTRGYDGGAQFSPDGRWLAYATSESGRFEVYLRPYPGPDRRVPVSTDGGTHPRWNPAGRELFYRSGNRIMAVDVSAGPDLTLSVPRLLFEQRYVFGYQTVANYDVSPDGQRFLMVKGDSSSGRINVVLNWHEELKRLAPLPGR